MEDLTINDLAELLAGVELPEEPIAVCAEIPARVIWDGDLVGKTTNKECNIDCIGGMVAWSFSDKKFRHFSTHENFCRYILSIGPTQRTYCERIYQGQNQKLRLDIDSEESVITAESMRAILSCICEVFISMFGEYLLSEYVYVCDSSRAGKQSYHIIIDRYYVRDHTTARKFAESVRDMLVSENYNDAAECIDMNIYKSVTGLRSAYNYKKDPNSVKKIPLGNYNYCS